MENRTVINAPLLAALGLGRLETWNFVLDPNSQVEMELSPDSANKIAIVYGIQFRDVAAGEVSIELRGTGYGDNFETYVAENFEPIFALAKDGRTVNMKVTSVAAAERQFALHYVMCDFAQFNELTGIILRGGVL